jgi:hypothetical protein
MDDSGPKSLPGKDHASWPVQPHGTHRSAQIGFYNTIQLGLSVNKALGNADGPQCLEGVLPQGSAREGLSGSSTDQITLPYVYISKSNYAVTKTTASPSPCTSTVQVQIERTNTAPYRLALHGKRLKGDQRDANNRSMAAVHKAPAVLGTRTAQVSKVGF